MRKYRWQNAQAIGRFEIEQAINQAETDLVNYLGFYPGPLYQTVKLPLGCPVHRLNYFNLYSYQRRYSNELKLGIGKLVSVCTVTRQLLGNYKVQYSDKNGDSLNDYFKIDFSDSTSDPADLEAYFTGADQLPLDDSDADYQVRPVRFYRLNPTTIRLEGFNWLLVKPAFYENTIYPGFDPSISGTNTSGALEVSDNLNFVSTLDIYKKVYSNTNKVTLTVTDFSGNTSDPADLEAYFTGADQLPLDDSDADYQVRPVRFYRLNPTTIRLEGFNWLLVKPAFYENTIYPGFDPSISGTNTSGALEVSDNLNFVSTLDIYKKVYSNTNKVTLTVTDFSGNSTVSTFNVAIHDPDLGLIQVNQACFDAAPVCYCSVSSAFYTVNFISGDDLNKWKATIARLALADIAAPLCPCESLEVEHWQNDRAVTGNGQGGFSRIDNDDLKNPFGTREGQIAAWHQVKNQRILGGLGN
ncbi:MAG: hypothetical protein BGO39_02965 [Chloroflexi bacterium 54-19]|nr:MAG: hypothetical protein BGO39_02965 [Chloroflexi bacterium 54-19]